MGGELTINPIRWILPKMIRKLEFVTKNDNHITAACTSCNDTILIDTKNCKLQVIKQKDKTKKLYWYELLTPISCGCGEPYSRIDFSTKEKERAKRLDQSVNTSCLVTSIVILATIAIILRGVFQEDPIIKEQEIAKEKEKAEFLAKSREAEAKVLAAREEGARALEEFDNAIRENAGNRRRALEKAAASHKHFNISANIAVDSYIMKDGRQIVCSTKVLPTAPAIFDCDGEP